MNPSNLSLRQKSRGTVVKTIAIHLYGARDPNYIVDLTCRTSSGLPLRFSLSGQRSYAYVMRAEEGEPGNEASQEC